MVNIQVQRWRVLYTGTPFWCTANLSGVLQAFLVYYKLILYNVNLSGVLQTYLVYCKPF